MVQCCSSCIGVPDGKQTSENGYSTALLNILHRSDSSGCWNLSGQTREKGSVWAKQDVTLKDKLVNKTLHGLSLGAAQWHFCFLNQDLMWHFHKGNMHARRNTRMTAHTNTSHITLWTNWEFWTSVSIIFKWMLLVSQMIFFTILPVYTSKNKYFQAGNF